MAKETSTQQWQSKIEAGEKRYLQRHRKLKEQIRMDESLPDLDRAVLGATGSPEELKRYQDLARKIGGLAGQPIIKIEETQDGKVMNADAGLIAGPVEASLDYWSGVMGDEEKEFSGSTLKVPVSPSVVYMKSHKTPICRSRREQEMFFDEQNSLYDREEKISRVEIARIWPIKSWVPGRNQITEPSQDFVHRIPFGSVLVGREAIYASSHFSEGVSDILLAIEKYPSEESRPELKLAS
jgi:hypothetical protein